MNLEASTVDTTVGQSEPTFDVLPLSEELRRAVSALGFLHPTPVQRAVFEPASQGLDLVVQARTGTGKTAAFGLPLVDRLVDPELDEAQALILAPTRELALQISRELEALARFKPVRCAAVYGGAPMQPQIDALRSGVQVIVGTPGRVLDHLERRTLDPSTLQLLILDESDEMLSMGFLPQITKIMGRLPEEHQTLLFSATVPPDIKRIAETKLINPRFITLSGDHIGALSIDHFVYRSRGAKSEEIVQLIEVENPESAIIFCNTRDQTKRIAGALQRAGYSADWLNADLSQSDREKVMAATRKSELRFLVATDVAARGIDISHLTHVINADFPESTENYVHRTGRTGRAGRTGTAVSLITPQDVGNLYMLRLTYKIFPIERELPSQRELQSRREADLLDFLTEAFSATVRPDDLSLARRILQSEQVERIVAGLLRDHLGARPGAADAAAQKRRDQMPAAEAAQAQATDVAAAERASRRDAGDGPAAARSETTEKKRKKRDKERARDEPFAVRGAEPPRNERPADREEPSPELEERGRRSSAEGDSERKKKRDKDKKKRKKEDFATGEARSEQEAETAPRAPDRRWPEDRDGTGGLEVVSAAEILGSSQDDWMEAELESSRAASATPTNGHADHRHAPRLASQDKTGDETCRIFVSLGRDAGLHPKTLRAFLEAQGIHEDDIEFVAVKDRHSFVGVVEDLGDEVIGLLDGAEIAGSVARAERARPRGRGFA